MSKLRTYELQNPDSASVNIELTPSGGTVLSGVVTATTLKVGTGVTISSGVVSATSFSGDGSALTGIDATSLKDSGDTIRVQANTSGAVVTGVVTATSFSGPLTGNITGNLTGNVTGDVTGNVNAGVVTATSSILVGNSFVKATSIGIGTTDTTGRNAGVSTATGTLIFNSTTNSLEIFNDGWYQLQVSSFLIDALVVAGGGSGGGPYGIGAGGGAGGVLYSTSLPITNGSYPITVGAGGPLTGDIGGTASNGSPSNFGSYTAIGGGYGGSYGGPGNGTDGGSGGGSGQDLRGQPTGTFSPPTSRGTGSQTPSGPGNEYARMTGYGNPGGLSRGDGSGPGAIHVAGGGGAGGAGTNGNPGAAPGGPGLTFTIPGSPLTVGGGGGANGYGVPPGSGGPGGGGGGYPSPQVNGSANTGGGGGGASYVSSPTNGGSGGSGVVILKVPTKVTAAFSGGLTVSTSTSQPGYNTYTVTAGTGTVTFS